MKIDGVSVSALNSTPLKKNSDFNKVFQQHSNNISTSEYATVPTVTVLAQLPNVNFGAKRNYGRDDLSLYDTYSGPRPPEIEIKKYIITRQVDEHIEMEDYLSAIKGKIDLARICKSQGKDDDAFILEESIRRLYKDLPKYQKSEAKRAISTYNKDMAKYIDKDIERYY